MKNEVRYVSNNQRVGAGIRVTRVTEDGRFEVLVDSSVGRWSEVRPVPMKDEGDDSAIAPPVVAEDEQGPVGEIGGETEGELPSESEPSPGPDFGDGSDAPWVDHEEPQPTLPTPPTAPAPAVPISPTQYAPFPQYPAGAVSLDNLSPAQIQSAYNGGARDFVTSGWLNTTKLYDLNGAAIYWTGEQEADFWLGNCDKVRLINPRFRNERDQMRVFMQFLDSARNTEVHSGQFIGASDPFKAVRDLPNGILDQSRTGIAYDTRMAGVNFGFGGMSMERCVVFGYQGDGGGMYRNNHAIDCIIASALKANRNHDDGFQLRRTNNGAPADNVRLLNNTILGWTGDPSKKFYRSEDVMAGDPWGDFGSEADPSWTQGAVSFDQPFPSNIEMRGNVIFSNLWNGLAILGGSGHKITGNRVLRENPQDLSSVAPAIRTTGDVDEFDDNVSRGYMGNADTHASNPNKGGGNRLTDTVMNRQAFLDEFNREFLTLDVVDFNRRIYDAADQAA